jgi:hypothetical protein
VPRTPPPPPVVLCGPGVAGGESSRAVRGRRRSNSQLDSSFWHALSTKCRSYLDEIEFVLIVPFVSSDASRSIGARTQAANEQSVGLFIFVETVN